jgi:hypothetical protein
VDGAQESSQFHIEMLNERPEGIIVVVICDSDLHLTQEISCEQFILQVYDTIIGKNLKHAKTCVANLI